MKIIKAIALTFLILTFLVLLLTACSKSPQPVIWDGTVAESFSGGNGQKDTPFEISTPAELAYLAKSVNEGNEYQEQYFILKNDLDLASFSWTPIGNGIHSFMGSFDGKGHTIKNLNISEGVHYRYKYPTGQEMSYCDLGLFATVQDASIRNIKIDGATIKASDYKGGNVRRVGVLCGTVRTYQGASVISSIEIKNATITTDFSTRQSPLPLSIGGAIGNVYAYNDTATTISLIETDCTVSFTNGYSSDNYMGTILGSAAILDSTFTLENCAAYQTLSITPEQYYYTMTRNFCGAIGNAQASAKPFNVKNVFSKCKINKPVLDSAMVPPPAIVSHVIIGEAYYFALKDDPNAVGYNFENIFGCVEHIDTKGEKTIFTELYKLPEGPSFAEVNCQGGEALPENHGFDTNIWDLSDISNPKLK